jgi:hypothetical protein
MVEFSIILKNQILMKKLFIPRYKLIKITIKIDILDFVFIKFKLSKNPKLP